MDGRVVVLLLVCTLLPTAVSASDSSSFKVIVNLAPDPSDVRSAATIVKECMEVLKRPKEGNAEIKVKALWSRGCAYLRMRKPQSAMADFEALSKLKPNDAVFIALRALALADLGKMKEAETQALDALVMDPQVPAHYVVMGSIDAAQGKWTEAASAADSALLAEKEFPSALYLRGWVACVQGDYATSIACLNKYAELSPSPQIREPEHPYWIRGNAHLGLCRHREALSNFLTARKLNPSSALAAEGVCLTYIEMQKWHAAAKAAVELAALVPDEARIHQACAVVHARIGKRKEAEASLQKARKLLSAVEKDADALTDLNGYAAESYFYLGDYQKASKLVDDAFQAGVIADVGWWVRCRMQASCPDAKYRDGHAALKIATAMLNEEKQLKRIEQHQFAIYALLADAQAECRDFVNALASVRKAIEIAGDREVGDLRERINLFENKTPYRHRRASD